MFIECILFYDTCKWVPTFTSIFLLVSGYRLIWGVTSPMFASMINESIEKDDYRNTVFSMISLVCNLGSSVLLFGFTIMNVNVKYKIRIKK